MLKFLVPSYGTGVQKVCSAPQENGSRQKSKVCETFDHIFALLEEKKSQMTVRISSEQEEKLEYIRGLRRRYSEHLETTAKLLETTIQTLDQSEMAAFLLVSGTRCRQGDLVKLRSP